MESLIAAPRKKHENNKDNEDFIQVPGLNIEGENIVSRALRLARGAGFEIPPLDVKIIKSLPPGSGLGAGSGNGASI